MAEDQDVTGGGATGGRRRLNDEEFAERCRATEKDASVLDDVIQGRIKRGAIARTIALRIKLRYGHAVPKGEAIKPETQRPTVYVLEVPAGQSPAPVALPLVVRPSLPEVVTQADAPTPSKDDA